MSKASIFSTVYELDGIEIMAMELTGHEVKHGWGIYLMYCCKSENNLSIS